MVLFSNYHMSVPSIWEPRNLPLKSTGRCCRRNGEAGPGVPLATLTGHHGGGHTGGGNARSPGPHLALLLCSVAAAVLLPLLPCSKIHVALQF